MFIWTIYANWEYGIKGSQCPNRIEFEDAKKLVH